MLKIRELRVKRGLTVSRLAKFLDVTVSAVSQWENGKRMPDVNTLIRMSHILNCTVDDLIGRCAR